METLHIGLMAVASCLAWDVSKYETEAGKFFGTTYMLEGVIATTSPGSVPQEKNEEKYPERTL